MRGENNSMVDRRIIVKLLVTYFEKGASKEVLSLMARMLVRRERNWGKVREEAGNLQHSCCVMGPKVV